MMNSKVDSNDNDTAFDHETHLEVISSLVTQVQSLNIVDQNSLKFALAIRAHTIRPAVKEIEAIFGPVKAPSSKHHKDKAKLDDTILGRAREAKALATSNLKKTIAQVKRLLRPYSEAQEYIDEQIQRYDLQITAQQEKVYEQTGDELQVMAQQRLNDKAEKLRAQGKNDKADALLLTMADFKNPMAKFKPQRLELPSEAGITIAHLKLFDVLDVSKLDEQYLKPREANMVAIRTLVTEHGVAAESMVGRQGAIKVFENQPQVRNLK